MTQLIKAIQRIRDDEQGHVIVGVPSLVAAIGAVALGIGAAADSDVTAIAGGAVLGLGVFVTGLARHRAIDYEVFARLDKLEK
jgi:hypothetical protein